jgi:coniferyl-aldehyde dehydrogenase
MSHELARILQTQREAFRREGTPSHETRIDRLDRCIALIVDHKDEICEAVNEDFGCRSHHVTLMNDIFPSVNSLKFVKKHVRKWMQPERRKSPFPMGLLGARSEVHYQPKGIVGIMSPWNFPVNMVFSPLADVLGAGNRAMVKPSEFNPNTVSLFETLFGQYFDESEVAIVAGDSQVGAAFASLPLDHIIFTGSTGVGKLVMQAAAKNLVPVTLELGGKSPVIVSDTADIADVAEKIMTIKAMNAGQVCISPDYCFVARDKLRQFVSECQKTIAEQYPEIAGNADFVSMINEGNFDRIKGYIDDAIDKGADIVVLNPAGEDWDDRRRHKIPIHLIIDPRDDMRVMQEELFGPILCIKPYDKIDDCIAVINDRPRPLALYYLGKDRAEQQRVIDNTIAGGMCLNDLAMHVACDDMPFGGVGASGMGNYHGREGFLTFSHAKAIFRQGRFNLLKLSGTLPPYGKKVDKLMSRMIRK